MIKRILSVLIVVALLVAPLTVRPGKAVSGQSYRRHPSPQRHPTRQHAQRDLHAEQHRQLWRVCTADAVIVVSGSNVVDHQPGRHDFASCQWIDCQLGSSGFIYLCSSSAAFAQSTSYTVTITAVANIKTPVAPGSYSVTVGSSVYGEGTASYSLLWSEEALSAASARSSRH